MTPQEVINECDVGMGLGETKRIKHLFQSDGEVCSRDKDNACAISRGATGWSWYCFRCGERGFLPLSMLSPKSTIVNLKRNMLANKVKEARPFSLPEDFSLIKFDTDTPPNIMRYLNVNRITRNMCDRFCIGQSLLYNRVIFPIYEEGTKNLVGWLGREVDCANKKERQNKQVQKYILRKHPDHSRVFFRTRECYATGLLKNVVIVVEDIVSAILLNTYTGVKTIALLNTSIPISLVSECKDKICVLWLDRGQETNVVDQILKLNTWGLKAVSIFTDKDPKAYSRDLVIEILEGKLKECK